MSDDITRFSPRERIEHVSVMVLFIVLALTGLPQKYFESSTAVWIITTFGGINAVRLLHRIAGLLFTALVVIHLTSVVLGVLTRRSAFSMVPSRRDFEDAIATLRYYLGLTSERARFGRFDYRQKFEYWGLVMGGLVVSGTGMVLLFPIATTRLLPGELIPVAKVAHSYEGLMAFLVVVTWHIYNAHLSPDVFPFDTTIFTGKISRERMAHEHPLEYEQILAKERASTPKRVA
jgi:formate dehydrogenase gamma subunit